MTTNISIVTATLSYALLGPAAGLLLGWLLFRRSRPVIVCSHGEQDGAGFRCTDGACRKRGRCGAMPPEPVAQPLEAVCAWCNPNDHRPNVSHGICERHRREMLDGTEGGK